MQLPSGFIERMKKQLPKEEWEEFFAVYDAPPHKGLRVNRLKISVDEYKKISPLLLRQIPWAKDGFYTSAEKVGKRLHHVAGLIYSQEPSAMSAVPFLEIKPGEKVLDLCSAPGGKGTQMASDLQGEGLLVLNEPIFPRAQILSSNVERMGIKNAVVVNEYPQELAKWLNGYFDKILIDAPCSGEGMFRKNEKEAIEEWSEENIALCAERGKEILECGWKMLRRGGRLVYSTCTFAKEEDEDQIEKFLLSHEDATLVHQHKIYPHKEEGEGHFVAVLEKSSEEDCHIKEKVCKIDEATLRCVRAFEKNCLQISLERLFEKDGVVYALPERVFDWKNLHILRAGCKVGEVKNGRLTPSHALAMALKDGECSRVLRLQAEDKRVEKYLHGETIECDGENGWTLVLVDSFPVGWGKAVNGTLKNHLPKGIRL